MGFSDLVVRFVSRFLQYDGHLQSSYTAPRAPPLHVAMPRMPIEVIMHIMELTHVQNDSRLDVTSLKAASLVCKEWSVVAQKLLFRHVTLRSHSDFTSFCDAVDRSSPRGCMLGDSVVHLDCTAHSRQLQGLTNAAFAKALTLCPNLSQVSLTLQGDDRIVGAHTEAERHVTSGMLFDEQTLVMLRVGPQIAALHFDNRSSDHNALWQLLEVWPSLKSLSVSGTSPSMPSLTTSPVHLALEELRVDFQTPPATDTLEWLLHGSSDSLKVLEFHREPSAELLVYLLDNYGASLTSLALPSCASDDRAVALLQCTRLRELRIGSAGTLPSVLRGLPATLQHLALTVNKDSPLPPIAQAIRKNDALVKVMIHVCVEEERPTQLAAVKIACTLRGVELQVIQGTYIVRSSRKASGSPKTTGCP